MRRIFTKADAKYIRQALQNPISDDPKLLKWETRGLLRRVWSYNPDHYPQGFDKPVQVFTLTERGAEAWALAWEEV